MYNYCFIITLGVFHVGGLEFELIIWYMTVSSQLLVLSALAFQVTCFDPGVN
jgi:hypothetical protein